MTTMLSLSSSSTLKLTSTTITTTTTTFPYHRNKHHTSTITSATKPPSLVSNLIIPSSYNPTTPQPQNLYQPYRPPPNPLPARYKNLDILAIIEVLSNRLGSWHEYAPLISTLFRDGFTPPSIEELTGITGVDQNRLVVGAQVLESIIESSDLDPSVLSFFDYGGSEILYELRMLTTSQRASAAAYIVSNKLDGEKARDIARAIKDYPSRQFVNGCNRFDYTKPGDCWAFTFFRQSREFPRPSERRNTALATALDVAETEEAKKAILEEMEAKEDKQEDEKDDGVRVPVVRLKYGEVAEASSVVVLPVCMAVDGGKGMMEVPRECRVQGEFGMLVSDKGWGKWVVFPKWLPVAGIGSGGVAVAYKNGKVLPWRTNKWYMDEEIVVVADRGRSDVVADDGFYLVDDDDEEGSDDQGLKVVRGLILKEKGVDKSFGLVVIVVRPPRDEDDDQLNDEDWD